MLAVTAEVVEEGVEFVGVVAPCAKRAAQAFAVCGCGQECNGDSLAVGKAGLLMELNRLAVNDTVENVPGVVVDGTPQLWIDSIIGRRGSASLVLVGYRKPRAFPSKKRIGSGRLPIVTALWRACVPCRNACVPCGTQRQAR